MRILFLTAEAAPFVKVGGLADVAGSLPGALARLGHEVRVVLPLHSAIDRAAHGLAPAGEPLELDGLGPVAIWEADHDGVSHWFIDLPDLFERGMIYGEWDDGGRYGRFTKAAVALADARGWLPDVIHSNDWHTALAPCFATGAGRPATVLTIHNLAYQGEFEPQILAYVGLDEEGLGSGDRYGRVSFLGRGIARADAVNTVSPTYAAEITEEEHGCGLEGLIRTREVWGIVNGIDTVGHDPLTDPALAVGFDVASAEERRPRGSALLRAELGLAADPDAPLIGVVARLAEQKGVDLLVGAVEQIVERGAQLAVLGAGDPRYEEALAQASARHAGRVAARLAFDGMLAQRIYAGSDLFLMPSRFEPCGLGQLLAMRYGALPLVRHTGGLIDTVEDGVVGFSFEDYSVESLIGALDRGLAAVRDPERRWSMVRAAMARDHSWDASAVAYVELYEAALAARGA